MDSKYIEEAFENYLKTEITNHAMLINGSWGSGKTYFWKNNLVEKCNNNQFKNIYISLNGISKIEDLKYQFLIKIVPYLNILDSKKGNVGKTIITTLASALGNVNINDILKDVEIDSKKLSAYVVCFDDLERCLIPKVEVLGFINSYVEHKNLKVLILSDESKIIEEDNYNNIKEKVIGRILTYKNNLSRTLPLLFKKYETTDIDFYDFLNQEKEYILELSESYKEDNLRKISFYIELLKSLYPIIKDFKEYIKEVIMFTLIITIEFKTGNLTSNDYQDFKGYEDINSSYGIFNVSRPTNNNIFSNEEIDEEAKKSELEIFYEKYLTDTIDNYFFYSSIYIYILTGYLDKNKLLEELKSRYPEVIPQETIAFRKLLNYGFRQLPNDEFKKLCKEVFEYATEGKYGIYDYLQVSRFLNYFSECKLINIVIPEIQEGISKGIEISKQREETNKRLYDSIFHFKNKDDDSKIYDLIKEAHDSIEAKKESEKVNKLILALKENNCDLIDDIFKEYQVRKELFEFLKSNELFDVLLTVDNKTLSEFILQLEGRYSFSNAKDYLSEDYEFLNELCNYINEKLKDNVEYDIQEFLLNELAQKIKKICEKIH